MRLVLFCLLLLSCGAPLDAQQNNPYQVNYRSNWQAVNPAAFDRAFYLNTNPNNNPTMIFAGSSNVQWVGVEGAPRYYFVSAEYAPYLRDGDLPPMRYGFQIALDQTDILSKLHVGGNLTYRIKLDRRSKFLYIGTNVEFVNNQIDVDKVRLADETNDPLWTKIQADNTGGHLDASLGVFYRHMRGGQGGSKHEAFVCGFSMPQAIAIALTKNENVGLKRAIFRNFYAMAGWFLDPGGYDSGIDFEPTIWIRASQDFHYYTLPWPKALPLTMDVNLRAYFGASGGRPQPLWVGLGIGMNTMLSADIGYQWSPEGSDGQSFRIGLGYTYPLGRLVQLGPTLEATVALAIE